MTAVIITGIICLGIGLLIGRVWSVGHRAEHDMAAWRDHVIGCALLPRAPHLLELTAEEVQS
jgi:hypothetical protein